MSDQEFRVISEFIHQTWGLKMPPAKRVMLESRLSKRLNRLGLTTFKEYTEYLFSPLGLENELVHMIDVVSTNKTDFFREPGAFTYMSQHILPEMIAGRGAGVKKRLMVWSTACSTGEEPYTLAMVLSEFSEKYPGFGFDYFILATDVSRKVLDKAQRAVYEHERVEAIPFDLRRKFLMKSKDPTQRLYRVVPELRSRIRFRHMNLMEDFGLREPMDLIFCRNVIIYFERETQAGLLKRLCDQIVDGGYMIMGHSETLNGMNLPLVSVAPMIYRKVA
ncbi:MAG: chemotaxis protein CheR [Proteobacteria bacterium]|nr:chemotaxis protein CheR [Pseudomonadota bacterium]